MVTELQQAGGAVTAAILTMPPSPSPTLSKKDKEKKSKKNSKKASKSHSSSVSYNNTSTLTTSVTGSTPNFLATEGFKVKFVMYCKCYPF